MEVAYGNQLGRPFSDGSYSTSVDKLKRAVFFQGGSNMATRASPVQETLSFVMHLNDAPLSIAKKFDPTDDLSPK
jgi:hypothetical protein